MTKEKFIDLIIHRLSGGNTSADLLGKYDKRVVEKHATVAMNSVMFDLFRSNESALDLYAKDHVVQVQNNTTYDRYYADFPAQIIQLPGQAGIRLITAKQDPTFVIPVVPSSAMSSLANLDVGNLDDRMYGYVTQERVYFVNKRDDIDYVLMKLVIPLDEYDWDDNIYLPSGKGVEIEQLIGDLMLRMPKEDMINDNNSERP